MISQFVNDKATFNEVKEYINEYLFRHANMLIKKNEDTKGMHEAYRVIGLAFDQMEKDFIPKPERKKVDHSQ